MRYPILALATLAISATTLAAQKPTAADSAAVRAATLDYAEAIYRVDTARVVRSVRPEMAKRGYYVARGQTGYTSAPMTFEGLLETAKTWNKSGRINADQARKEIEILDILDQTASVKLVAEWGIDYMHLAKYDGKWMIVNVLWQSHPR